MATQYKSLKKKSVGYTSFPVRQHSSKSKIGKEGSRGEFPILLPFRKGAPLATVITSDPTTRKKNEKRNRYVSRSKWGVGGKHHRKIIQIFCRRLPTCEGPFPLPPLSYPLKQPEKT